MTRRRAAMIATLVVAVLATSACTHTTRGAPIAASGAVMHSSPSRSIPPAPTTDAEQPEPGVVPTTRAPVPADTVTCPPASTPAVGMQAQVADPQAPRIVVAVPAGWEMSAGSGDVAGRLTGPGGASATVTISATRLEPDAAFRDYTDSIMDQAPVSTVSILPAESCSLSGQKLTGTLADESGDGIEFTDHLVHVWTNAGDYLVAVHVQTPTAATVDDPAVAQITDDFEIRLP